MTYQTQTVSSAYFEHELLSIDENLAKAKKGVPHPIPYQGSKRSIVSSILQFFPSNFERLVEPFTGSAAVSLAAAYHGKATKFLINDINAPLMALWQEILDRPDQLLAAYSSLWHAQQGQERSYYDDVRREFNQTLRTDYFLYLLARCVKAAVRYNAAGEFNQSPDNRRKGARPGTMKMHVLGASALLRGRTTIESKRYEEILADASPHDVVYMDPPYQGVSVNRDSRYISGVSFEVFVNELDKLNEREISFILSYDGKTGSKRFGEPLPGFLDLVHVEINAGRSSQATLLGRDAHTFESLYLSPALVAQIQAKPSQRAVAAEQSSLFPVLL